MNFEEQFPPLENWIWKDERNDIDYIDTEHIEEFCLDKQKVLDAFKVLCRIYGISKEYQDAFIKDVGL